MDKLELSDDRSIYYRVIQGDPGRPCLVFLHEGLGCDAMWKGFPDRLCERTGCPGLVYDRQGYGQSSPLTGNRTIHYLHKYALEELPAVIDAIIPNRPYLLIGHSDGGSISLIAAADRPPLLRGIVVEAPHILVEPETAAGVRKADEAFDRGKLDGLRKYHGEKTESMFKAWARTWMDEKYASWSIKYLLPYITCPVLAIQGRQDHYGTAGQVDPIIEFLSGPAEAFWVEECGHSPHLEHPEKVIEKISGFVAAITGPGAKKNNSLPDQCGPLTTGMVIRGARGRRP